MSHANDNGPALIARDSGNDHDSDVEFTIDLERSDSAVAMQNKLHLPSLMSQMQQDSRNLKAGIEYLTYERESLETAIMRLEAETEHFSMEQEIETNEHDANTRLFGLTDPDRDEINMVDGCNTSGHKSFQSNSRDHQESFIAKSLTALGFDASNLHTFRPESIHIIYHALLSGYRRSNLAAFADQEEPGCFFCLEEIAIGNWAVAVCHSGREDGLWCSTHLDKGCIWLTKAEGLWKLNVF
ncbi:unnamed protein product [Fusarium graminearum]|uniref:Uncharacterized protein n=1 Tax=Gibberella zeae TaxID=5518 RepID=A0A4U9FBA2_GIBZA|nr:hypothetical protein FG05_05878 [Fusarium graminearum]CAF3460241.1 unnamed protein product [Fusarium graminearum]CZS84587.1 unnamed protein product [Fusarium graminearum]VTO93641.1 unnamed protein product [Fusarium graminearum]